jgi:hypothetical protein
MIDVPTCLLLGAGASAHLEFPLGLALKDRMVHELQSEIFKENTAVNLGIPPDVLASTDHVTFCRQLGFGGWTSPDAFLEKHPEHSRLGKHLIASLLRGHERENLLMTERRGWYSKLINAITADTPEAFRQNRLSVITYNYDRSVDCLIHRFAQHRFGLDSAVAWRLVSDVIPIVHLHGTLGPYPEVPYGTHEQSTETAANAIKIIYEVQDNLPEFQVANRCLEASERIIAVGFAFATQNVERLGFFSGDAISRRIVRLINGYIGSPGVDSEFLKWIEQWGFKREHLVDGDANTAFARQNPFRQ